MRIDFLDLANICSFICRKESYTRDGETQKWVSSVEGFDIQILFGNRSDRWVLMTNDITISFNFEVVVGPADNPSERGLILFGGVWGEARNCVYSGDPTKVQATLVMMKLLTPNAYPTNEHTFADFAEERHPPDVK